MKWFLFLLLLVSACTSQQDKDRIAELEKQTKDLQEQAKQQQQMVGLDTQAKCAAGATSYFKDVWQSSRDNTTIGLTYRNHYNKSLGKCFILVTHISKVDTGNMFSDNVVDVFERSEYGMIIEIRGKKPSLDYCFVKEQECKDRQDFISKTKSYMED